MALKFNNNTPKEIIYNGFNVAKVIYNNVVVWLQRILYTITGIPPLTANKSFGEPLVDYKIYGNSEQRNLPSEYQEVEYIENTASQYINTRIVPNNNTDIGIIVSDITETSAQIFVAGGTFRIAKFTASRLVGATIGSTAITSSSSGVDKFKAEIINKTLYLNNVMIGSSTDTVQTSVTLEIFRGNYGGAQFYSKFKCYGAYIKQNGELILDLVPCYRKSDNKPGMYDLVNDVFYTNAGTGEFSVGTNVTTPTFDRPIEIKSVGDLIADTNDAYYGKYKIPVKVNNVATNVYLDEPLRKIGNYADYIDYGEQKRITNVEVIDDTGELPIEQSYRGLANPIEETIILPDILTNAGANTIDVDTEVQPSNMEIKYEGTKF